MAVTEHAPADGSARAPVIDDGAPAPAPEPEADYRPSLQRRLARQGVHWGVRALSLAGAVLMWHLLTANDVDLWLRFSNLPGPTDTLSELGTKLTEGGLVSDMWASTWRILQGFALGAVLGVAAGVGIGRSSWVSDVLSPVFEVLRPIPAIAWVPISILLFAENEQGMVFITFLAALFPVVVATRHAVHALPLAWEDAVRTMGGSRRTILWRVVLPGALPGIFSGLSVAVGVGWICVISAEMISGKSGVGYQTWQDYYLTNYPAVIVGMLTIGFLGLVSAGVIELVGRWFTRWLPRSEART
jgi:NitT/TauT family transport system permease protein